MALGWKGSYYRYKEFFLNISALYREKADLRAFLEIVLSIVTAIVFLLFALKPTALTIISLLQQIKEEKQTLSVLTQKINDLGTANTLLTQNQNILQNIESAVSNLPNPDVLSKQVLGLGLKNSVEVLGIAINRVTLVGEMPAQKTSKEIKTLPENAYEMPFSISVKGNYQSLINFIKDVENLRISLIIDNLGITSSNTDSGRVIVAVISGRVPFLGKK
jgi:Tfp pilus assembly protein PilO